jgi:hypothetical protein
MAGAKGQTGGSTSASTKHDRDSTGGPYTRREYADHFEPKTGQDIREHTARGRTPP